MHLRNACKEVSKDNCVNFVAHMHMFFEPASQGKGRDGYPEECRLEMDQWCHFLADTVADQYEHEGEYEEREL